ncbi:DUF6678 family protein [Candidatus Uabimicrobium amorphum]|uniref:Uncharacterized protein n=2 Tax=Uabimicrobium amorphum TaxID=2596890 RepID=A0A5S9IKR2_UABAM|nr:hypothetical protein UABAM_01203 [Candidatus Uabimicrobium amorphum]
MDRDLLEIVNQRKIKSVISKEKWNKLCLSFDKISPEVRYKSIDGNEIYGFSKVWWHELFSDSETIEWIDIKTVLTEFRGRLIPPKEIDISRSILKILEKFNISYTTGEKYFRIWCYISSESSQ